MNYIEEQLEIITHKVENTSDKCIRISTCDAPNWDIKLHTTFPMIAERLRQLNYIVKCNVNWGVTDWDIVKIN